MVDETKTAPSRPHPWPTLLLRTIAVSSAGKGREVTKDIYRAAKSRSGWHGPVYGSHPVQISTRVTIHAFVGASVVGVFGMDSMGPMAPVDVRGDVGRFGGRISPGPSGSPSFRRARLGRWRNGFGGWFPRFLGLLSSQIPKRVVGVCWGGCRRVLNYLQTGARKRESQCR